jgi:hypothetical protein
MTTQVIEVGRPTVRWEAPQLSRVSIARLSDALCRVLAVILFVLALCLAGSFTAAGAGAPAEGPAPGLDL